jgi:plastocyanin
MMKKRTENRKIITIGSAVFILGLLLLAYVVTHRSGTTSALAQSANSQAAATYDSRIGTPDKDSGYTLVFDGSKLVSGPKHIRVKLGASVKININEKANEETKVHLEGYDIITESNPQAPGAFSFIADKAGTFNFYVIPDEDNSASTPAPIQVGEIEVK